MFAKVSRAAHTEWQASLSNREMEGPSFAAGLLQRPAPMRDGPDERRVASPAPPAARVKMGTVKMGTVTICPFVPDK